MVDRPTGTVTFLFTDVEGSTQLWEHHREWMEAAHRRHEAIVREAVAAHAGYAYKQTGDAFQAAFQTAPAALAAAVAAQQGLAAEDWGHPGPIRVRMGLHTGTVEERQEDYFGPLLNRTHRLMTAGHGGQILLTATTYELVRDHLPPRVELRDLGERRLKDLIRPEHVWQVIADGLPAGFPALRTLDSRPNNLPVQTNAFIGRERELAALAGLLRRPDVRLVTLTGPGGTGKTRLALQIAADLLDDFRHGVWFVDLAPVVDPALVIAALAQALSVTEQGNLALLDTLKSYLRDKHLLLLLDNFEQVRGAAGVVEALLGTAAHLKVLVTSRVRMQVYGEKIYPVPPLTLPTPGLSPLLNPLSQCEAVRLFIERAQDVLPDFAVTNATAPAVAEICVRLDGLPLAIELAAARVGLFPPGALLARLDKRLQILTGGSRTRTGRQQTLRGTIDWSYDLLTQSEQQLFRRLAVFQGGRTLDAIEAVCNATGDLAVDVVDGIDALVSHSLLQQREGRDSQPRFWLLETIHEYAREKLATSGEQAALAPAHAHYFVRLAEEAETELWGPRQGAWLKRLEDEHDNLRAALYWARQEGREGDAAALGLRLAGALWRFWHLQGYYSEGRTHLAEALAVAGAAPNTVLAKALNGAGTLASDQGDSGTARAVHEESLALRRKLGDRQGIAVSLHNLGNVAQARGDISMARAFYEESLTLRRELGNRGDVAYSLMALGQVAADGGDYRAAHALHEEGLALLSTQGDHAAIAMSLNCLGLVAFAQGEYEAARVLFEESMGLRRALGDPWGRAWTLTHLGLVAFAGGDYEAVRRLCAESLALQRELGDRLGAAASLNYLGGVAAAEGDYATARSLYRESLALQRELGHRRDISWSLNCLGLVAAAECDYATARALHEESLAIGRVLGNRPGIAASLAGLGGLLAGRGARGDRHLLERAARVLGAMDTLLASMGAVLERVDRLPYEQAVVALQDALSEDGFAAAWTAGQALSLDEAIAEALAEA